MLVVRALTRFLAARTREDHGFSMVITLGVMTMLLLSAAVTMETVQGDQPVARADREEKVAFAAAEAGIQVFVHKMLVNNSYWDQCAVPADGLSMAIGQGASDTRSWKNLPDSTAAYTIEILPANGQPKCLTSDPEKTVIDTATATFRIRVTGSALSPSDGQRSGPKRSLIATFKRKSFLDFIYFTDFEVTDPTTYASYPAYNNKTLEDKNRNPNPPKLQRDIVSWGNSACAAHAYEKGENDDLREDQQFVGSKNQNAGWYVSGAWQSFSARCSEIRFVDGDKVQGPMHSNDSLLLCGSPAFGRKPGDAIETSAPGNGTAASSYRVDTNATCGLSYPEVNYENKPVTDVNRGTWRYNQPLLQLPASNKSLSEEAAAAYTFSGQTDITMATNGITVTGWRKDGTRLNNTFLNYPSDGVIYVDNRKDPTQGALCSSGYSISAPYDDRSGCGIARVKGTYSNSLTIAAADDILVMDDTMRSNGTPALLGLIANNFIRVYHKVVDQSVCNSNPTGAVETADSPKDVQIDAALLTLTHSFIVDNYRCGTPLGTLTVNGAISQRFRGPVGTGGRTASTGYIKNYIYDDRLAVRSPPKFLDPVQSAWRIKTFQEQVPATPSGGI